MPSNSSLNFWPCFAPVSITSWLMPTYKENSKCMAWRVWLTFLVLILNKIPDAKSFLPMANVKFHQVMHLLISFQIVAFALWIKIPGISFSTQSSGYGLPWQLLWPFYHWFWESLPWWVWNSGLSFCLVSYSYRECFFKRKWYVMSFITLWVDPFQFTS